MKKLSVVVVVLLLVSMVGYGAAGRWEDSDTLPKAWTTGKAGIGKISPDAKLHVECNQSGPIAEVLQTAIYGYNSASTYDPIGVWGKVNDASGKAIYGYNGNSSGFGGYFVGKGYFSGDVGIGTDDPQSELAVNGTITTKRVTVTETGWSDFVFADDYKLMPLSDLSRYIKTNKSLPGIPTEKDVTEKGVDVGDMQAKFLEKIEELTLYMIELKKDNEELRKTNEHLERRISTLEK